MIIPVLIYNGCGYSRGMETTKSRIDLQFDVHDPIDLVDLTLSLGSFGSQYQKFIKWKNRNSQISEEDLEQAGKLCITKIESNCIITELAGCAATTLPQLQHTVENINTFLQFGEYFKAAMALFIAKDLSKWQWWKLKKADYTDWAQILEPVAKTKTGKVRLAVKEYKTKEMSHTLISYEYESDKVLEAQQGALKLIRDAEVTEAAEHKLVVMHMPQMHEKISKKSGKSSRDMGIIESIFPKELPVLWLSDMDAQRVKSQARSPFTTNYIVDVNVQRVAGVPRAYRIIRLEDIIENEPETSES